MIVRFQIVNRGKEFSMAALIHESILKIPARKDGGKIEDYRGGKLKVFQCFDLTNESNGDTEEVEHTLFELGTLTAVGSFKNPINYAAHSVQYYEKTMAESISVYNNWRALCLFDTFTMVRNPIF